VSSLLTYGTGYNTKVHSGQELRVTTLIYCFFPGPDDVPAVSSSWSRSLHHCRLILMHATKWSPTQICRC